MLLQALTRASIKNWTMPGHCLFGTAQFVYRGSGQDNLGCAAPGAPFLRKIGIEISFARKGRARTRTIHIATPPSQESTGARPSASSAPSAPAPKSNPANGFAVPPPRTVTNDADGRADDSGKGGASTVRANPLKSNAETAADGADANHPPQSGPEKLVRAAGGRGC